MSEQEKKIDEDLNSRAIFTYGLETMQKLSEMKVLIIGMRGLGIEVAKNIILNGLDELSIYDPNPVKINDLGSNFYLSETDVGKKNRDEACIDKLSKLNPTVKVSLFQVEMKDDFNEFVNLFCEKVQKFNVIVFTEFYPITFIGQIDMVCRAKNIKIIYGLCLGLAGYIFSDFGPFHTIIDDNGKPIDQYIIKSISKDKNGKVEIDTIDGTNNLKIGDGDFVKFKHVEGMVELNDDKKLFPIYGTEYNSFYIGDTSNFSEYTKGGVVFKVKQPIYKQYQDFIYRTYSISDMFHPLINLDFSKPGRAELLYTAFYGLNQYFLDNKLKFPELNNLEQAKIVVENAKKFYEGAKIAVENSQKTYEEAKIVEENAKKAYEEAKTDEEKQKKYEEAKMAAENARSFYEFSKQNPFFSNIKEFDEKIVMNVARWASANIQPVCAFFGGIIAQEIIKATGIYIPIEQWLIGDFFETVENIKDDADRTLKNCRYDDQIAIFGNEIQKKIEKTNILQVGAGATGCEFLKNFSMMGFCSDKGSEFTVVDNDNIEISNLTRQFLFRRNNVGQSKSIVGSKSAKEMNQSFNVKGIQSKVCQETEKVFDEKFWEKQDIIIFAVDSVDGRKYLDSKVLFFHKPAVDSGTEGVVAKSQVIIPYKTCSYLDKASTQPPKTIPFCTLSNFPSLIQHCIEWSKDSFHGYFGSIINDVRDFFADYEKFKRNIKSEGGFCSQMKRLILMKLQIDIIINKDLNKMCEYAIKSYTENFDHKIQQLLITFPPDSKSEQGFHFWVGSRRLPHPIHFDPNIDLCLNYIIKFVYILSHALDVKLTKEQLSSENIKKICLTIKPPEFVAKKMKIDMGNNSIQLSEVEAEQNSREENEAKSTIEELFKELDKIRKEHSQFDYKNINPEKFEKDHEDNGHIDFIHYGANLRAENYGIDKCDRNKTKQIAGKIISTVLTTTASIAGITSLQLYTMLQTNENKYFRESLIDLGSNNYCLMQPRPPIKMKDKKPNEINKFPKKMIPEGWNNWDRIEIKGSKTCGELLDYLKMTYNIDVEMLYVGTETPIYNIKSKLKNNKGVKIEEAYEKKTNTKIKEDIKYFLLTIIGKVPEAKIENETFENVSVDIPPIKYIFK